MIYEKTAEILWPFPLGPELMVIFLFSHWLAEKTLLIRQQIQPSMRQAFFSLSLCNLIFLLIKTTFVVAGTEPTVLSVH